MVTKYTQWLFSQMLVVEDIEIFQIRISITQQDSPEQNI